MQFTTALTSDDGASLHALHADPSPRYRPCNRFLVSEGALVMICNVIAIAIGKATIKHPNEGAQLPNPAFFGGMGRAALLATTSLGHVMGIGAIQGLAARGVL